MMQAIEPSVLLRLAVCCGVLGLPFPAASAPDANVIPASRADVSAPPEIASQFDQYRPQIKAFVAYNVEHLRSGPLLRSTFEIGFSPLKGITTNELTLVQKNLAHFGVNASPADATPSFLFVTPESADDLRSMLVHLGVPRDRASVEWSIYLQTSEPCYLQTLNDSEGGQIVVAVARAQATAPKPAVCLNNTVLNALGLYRSLEQFPPVTASPLSRWVDVDFIDRVSKCKTPSKVADAIAECVMDSYSFLRSH